MQLKQLFDQSAQTYDHSRRYLIPRFDEFYGAVLERIPFEQDQSFDCLDLGAGTGLLTALLAAAFPNARFTMLDLSEHMLAQAMQRFGGGSKRFSTLQMDYRHTNPPDKYQVVVSALSIHHLEGHEKAALFHRLINWLIPGGIFINADQVLGDTPEIEAAYQADWLDFVQASPISESEYAAALERLKLDRFSSLADQLTWLQQAGFEQVALWYQYQRFVVYSGVRPNTNNRKKGQKIGSTTAVNRGRFPPLRPPGGGS